MADLVRYRNGTRDRDKMAAHGGDGRVMPDILPIRVGQGLSIRKRAPYVCDSTIPVIPRTTDSYYLDSINKE